MPLSHTDVRVKRSVTGLGLFTLRDIPANRRIIEYVGELIDEEEADRRGGKYLFALGGGRNIDGRARANLARYINHSCRPTAVAYITGRRIWVWSRRRIQAGEELTLDYGPVYFDQHIRPHGCKCEACADPREARE